MEPLIHPDPFGEAARRALQRTVQVASSVATAAQILIQLRTNQARLAAGQDEQTRQAYERQARADRAVARVGWAPALDPSWMRQADLIQTARTWAAAVPYADPADPWSDSSAAVAVQRCEERLRVLHPYAMRRYDAHRGEGLAPVDAMREAAPFFAYAPNPREPDWQARLAVSAAASARPDRPAEPSVRPGRQPWQQDFPVSIRDVVARPPGRKADPQPGGQRRPPTANRPANPPRQRR